LTKRATVLLTALLLLAYAAVLIATNSRLTILADESQQMSVANTPPGQMMATYWFGPGMQEHPPLADILVSTWVHIAGPSLASGRGFAVIIYLVALLVLAFAGRRIAGSAGYWAVLLISVAWPFGFYYGRLAGWYAPSFLFVSCLTLAYLYLLENPTAARFALFALFAITMEWSSYLGPVMLLLILLDLLLFERSAFRGRWKALALTVAVVVIAFFPLLPALHNSMVLSAAPENQGVVGLKPKIMEAAFSLFSLFASISVAPWYLPLSLPIAAGVLVVVVLCFRNPIARRWMIWFLVIVAALTMNGQISLKRILFITPWFLLALAGTAAQKGRSRPICAASLALAFGLGWYGIANGKHFSMTTFHEPWQQLAGQTAQQARQGATIVSEIFPYYFYLDHDLGIPIGPGNISPVLPETVYAAHGYRIVTPYADPNRTYSGQVIVVHGIGSIEGAADADALVARLSATCHPLPAYLDVPDPAALYKQRSGISTFPYRVEVHSFQCAP
jgi:hypothetical protein